MLVLASHSPRRRELLANAGIEFVCRPAAVEERRLNWEDPRAHVERLAREKAMAAELGEGEVILAADTEVVLGREVLGKPLDAGDAARMLRDLSGREHEVITAICLRWDDRMLVDSETTLVRFIAMTEAEIAEYVASGEPMDKAGAYAIQGRASKFIDRIEGCYFNVVGLPVSLLARRLRELSATRR